MKVLVLGAGVVGTTSAWYLARAGHQVTVVDRQPVAGNETSFANGGQISVSHAEPWANPHVLPRVLKWLGREDAPLLWRWRADPAQLSWGLRFLAECLPGRTRQNIAATVALALYSRQRLQALRQELGLQYDHLERGILHIYTDQDDFAQAVAAAKVMGATRWQIFKDVLFWESLQPSFVGLRSAVSMALVIVVVAEMFIGSENGLGNKIIDAQQVFNVKEMYSSIIITGAVGYGLNVLFMLLEKHLIHWSGKA